MKGRSFLFCKSRIILATFLSFSCDKKFKVVKLFIENLLAQAIKQRCCFWRDLKATKHTLLTS